jgi:hypothetical protein
MGLGPLITAEFDYKMNQIQALSTGTLPGIYLDDSESDRLAVLDSYAATYVKEEVQAEALTRNLEGFSRFGQQGFQIQFSFIHRLPTSQCHESTIGKSLPKFNLNRQRYAA